MIKTQRIKTTALLSLTMAAVLALSAVLGVQKAFAATGNMYVSPSTSSVQNGNNVTVNVRVNPGATVNTVHVVVNFSTSALSYQGLSYAGSPFNVQPVAPSVSGGTVSFDQVNLSGTVSSDSFIASLTFTARQGSGSSSINLSGSNAANAGTATNPSLTAGSINFTSPSTSTPTPPSTPAPTPVTNPAPTGGSTSSGSSSSSSKSSTSTKPSGSSSSSTSGSSTTGSTPSTDNSSAPNVTVKDPDVGFTQATVVASSDVPTKVVIKYGIDGQLTSATAASDFATDHNIAIDPSQLIPGTTYSYVVISVNEKGVQTQSEVKTFHTKGMSVAVRVLDANNKPLKNKEVTLHSEPQTAKTDNNGYVLFSDVAPGNHKVIYSTGKKSYDQQIAVTNNIRQVNGKEVADKQNFAVAMRVSQSSSAAPLTMSLLVLLVLAGAGVYLWQRRRPKFAALPDLDMTATVMSSAPQSSGSVDVSPTPTSSQEFLHHHQVAQPGSTVAPNQSKDEQN